jgi:hypothetical protein
VFQVDASKPSSSTDSPIRRYAWTDHEPNKGDTVSYSVTPVIQTGLNAPQPDPSLKSGFSKPVTLSAKVSNSFECYFNRGLVISQFMSKQLKGDFSDANLKKFKSSLDTSKENSIRDFLGGDLRKAMIALLEDLQKNKGEIYLAMFELSDEALVSGLKALGDRAHIVLSN